MLFNIALISCSKDEDVVEREEEETSEGIDREEYEIEDFVYSGMQEVYLYKADVPELANNYFDNSDEQYDYYASFATPEDLFDDITASFDRFSFIVDDYNELENSFNGISGATGIEYGVGRITGTDNIFGFIQYVLPNTSASEAGLERGNIFTEVDGQALTLNNFERLISQDSFTINVGSVVDGTINLEDRTVTLTDDRYTSNPVYIEKVFEVEGRKIGYLMYNSFIADFDEELNTAFGNFKAEGVTDLIVDLRYNGGGSVDSAVDLASMITGQFEGEIFMREQWNERYQTFFEANEPDRLINRFNNTISTGSFINSLNLNQVYVLTSSASASASELIINGLTPYIDVVQVGDATAGKFQASVTLYDSPDYSKDHVNLNQDHNYAIQPLVFKSINVDGTSDYVNGLDPDIEYIENLSNMGVLGDINEPLLNIAISAITGMNQSRKAEQVGKESFTIVEGAMRTSKRMYSEKTPPRLN